MVIEKQQIHRPGALKQTNKAHKHGRHRSKGSISIASKGFKVKIALCLFLSAVDVCREGFVKDDFEEKEQGA